MSAEPAPDLETRLADAHLALRRAGARARRAADAAVRVADTADADLDRELHLPARLWLLRRRDTLTSPLRALRHPIRTTRNIVAKGVRFLRLHRIGPWLEPVRFTASPLRLHPAIDRQTDQPDLASAVRWLGPVRIAGVVRHGLLAHPTSSIAWMLPPGAGAGATITANCAIVPEAILRLPHGVIFDLSARAEGGGWTATSTLVTEPRIRGRDRQWRTLAIAVPADVNGPIEVRCTTRLPDDRSPEFAWALWGDPRLTRRRSIGSIARTGRALVQRDGLWTTLRRVGQVAPLDARAQYRLWLATHEPTPADLARLADEVRALPQQPTISIIVPVYNTDVVWLRACIDSVIAQGYPNWELCLADDASTSVETVRVLDDYAARDPRIRLVRLAQNGHISAASNAALDVATGEFVALLDHDDELSADALTEIVRFVNAHSDVDFIYTDEDKRDMGGARIDPYFKPDWSPEHFLNFMYTNHLMVLRRSIVEQVGRFRLGYEGAQDFDLALRIVAQTTRIGHLPKVLYHWRQIPGSAAAEAVAKPWALDNAKRALESYVQATGLRATVEPGAGPGLFRVRRAIAGAPLVTLVITTDDRTRSIDGRELALLPNVLRSIHAKTTYRNCEILVIDNGKLSEASAAVLRDIPHRRVTYRIEGAFNFAHKLNFSVRHAQGEQLVILNDDVEVITPDWIEALLEHAQDPAIGAVGAKLYYPDGRLQHAGIVMGVCGVAAHVFHQAPGTTPGYFGSTLGPRNYSAVTGACLMTRRAVFDEVGGFDERLAIDFNDVDYCLRLREAGYRIVFTPHAELVHHESGSHGVRTWNASEANYMRQTWTGVLASDPYYNRNLSRTFPDYRLGD